MLMYKVQSDHGHGLLQSVDWECIKIKLLLHILLVMLNLIIPYAKLLVLQLSLSVKPQVLKLHLHGDKILDQLISQLECLMFKHGHQLI